VRKTKHTKPDINTPPTVHATSSAWLHRQAHLTTMNWWQDVAAFLSTVGAAVGEVITWWRGLAAEQTPTPWTWLTLAFTLTFASAFTRIYPRARHLVTFTHETGHAFIAKLTGRRVAAVRLHTNTSGTTTSIGRPGISSVLTAAGGYPAPAAAAGLLLAAAITGHTVQAFTLAALITALVLLVTRNAWGVLITAGVLAGFLLTFRFAPVAFFGVIAAALAGLLAGGALRDIWTERRVRRADPTASTDVASIARSTHLPTAATWLGMLLLTVTAFAAPVLLAVSLR